MHMLEHRLHILLDDERYRKVLLESERRSVSLAAVIREAIDFLPIDNRRRQEAIAAIMAAQPMEVPDDPSALRTEIDRTRGSIS
jgi:hypothetical protein